MTKHEARRQAQRAATQARIAALHQQARQLDAQDRADARKARQRRLLVVGTLVEAAGLLDAPDDRLEKAFRAIAECWARVEEELGEEPR